MALNTKLKESCVWSTNKNVAFLGTSLRFSWITIDLVNRKCLQEWSTISYDLYIYFSEETLLPSIITFMPKTLYKAHMNHITQSLSSGVTSSASDVTDMTTQQGSQIKTSSREMSNSLVGTRISPSDNVCSHCDDVNVTLL